MYQRHLLLIKGNFSGFDPRSSYKKEENLLNPISSGILNLKGLCFWGGGASGDFFGQV